MSRSCKPDSRRSRPVRPSILIEAIEARILLSATASTTMYPGAVYLRPATTASAAATTTTGVDDVDGYTPAQVRAAYGFDAASFSGGTVSADGSGQTIAIVDAYNDPNIGADLKVFDAQFGIAGPPSLRIVNQNGAATLPATNADWAGEIALDVEWAHAIAPGASLLLVEASSDNTDDLLSAVNYARATKGVSVVSMSWGGSEFVSSYQGGESAAQTTYDTDFTTPVGHAGVTFVAAAGDSGQQAGVQWPASSPNVLSVGGTTLSAGDDGTYQSETGWAGTSSGYSTVEAEPAFQQQVGNTTGHRGVADVAYGANADQGFKVYDSLADDGYAGWQEVGGTSAGSPQWAALVAIADQGRFIAGLTPLNGTSQTLPDLYDLYAAPTDTAAYATYTTYFNDITSGGTGGANLGHGHQGSGTNVAKAGYDLVTGLGTPHAAAIIGDLATAAAGTTTTTPTPTPTPTPTVTLSPVGITLLTTPLAEVIGGATQSVKVRLTNTATGGFAGPISVTVSASTDGTTAGVTTTLDSTTISDVKLRAGGSRVVTLRFVYPTDLPTGSYYLLAAADATGTATQATTVATATPVSLAAPSVDLAVAFADATAVLVTPGKAGKVVVRISNLGNVAAKGNVVLTLSASTAGTADDVLVPALTRRVKIPAGKAVTLSVRFTPPADLAAGSYSLVASIVTSTSPVDTDTANDTATLATQ